MLETGQKLQAVVPAGLQRQHEVRARSLEQSTSLGKKGPFDRPSKHDDVDGIVEERCELLYMGDLTQAFRRRFVEGVGDAE